MKKTSAASNALNIARGLSRKGYAGLDGESGAVEPTPVDLMAVETPDWYNKASDLTANPASTVRTARQIASQLQAPEDQGAASPTFGGMGEAAANVGRGAMQIPDTVGRYIKETSEKPDPSARLGEDFATFGKTMYHGAVEDPAGFVGGALPVVGNMLAGADISKLKDMSAKARSQGDEATASKLDQLAAVSAASVALPVGAGVASKAAVRAGERAVARELSPLGLYSHGAETAVGLPQAKGTPQQMAGMLQRQGVRPEEMFSTGFADEAATNAMRSRIEAEFTPKVEEARIAMEGLTPGTPEFQAAERQYKNIASTMRGDMDRALVLGEDWAARPSVTREELSQHFNEKMPQIEETILKDKREPVIDEREKKDWIESNAITRAEQSGDIDHIREWDNASPEIKNWHREEALKDFNEQIMDPYFAEGFQTYPGVPPKFKQYTLPGGENYREVLLKMPEEFGASKQAMDDLYAARERAAQASKAYNEALEQGLTGDMQISYDDFAKLTQEHDIARARLKNFEQIAKQSGFKSSHWDDPNVLAHIRMSDRTGPNGEKILHVEEIQSDWAQSGRKEGFAQKPDPKILNELNTNKSSAMFKREQARESFNDAYEDIFRQNLAEAHKNSPTPYDLPNTLNEYNKHVRTVKPETKFQEYRSNFLRYGDNYTPEQRMRLQDAHDAHVEAAYNYSQARDALSYYKVTLDGVPNAPYVTNTQAWTDLALKRVLKEAAEGGYDKVVWTPGAEQAKRYDLSKQISRLVLEDNKDGGQLLRAYSPSGDQVISKSITNPEKELPNLIGKEVSERLLSQNPLNPKRFNEDLKTNDITVVSKENRYQISAPWGWAAHVGKGTVSSEKEAAEYAVNYFNKMAKEANRNLEYQGPVRALEGQELSVGGEGMKGYYDKIVPTQLQKIIKKHDPEAKIGRDAIGSGKYEVVLSNGKVIAEYPEKVSADIIARKQPGATVRQNGLEVPSLTITPKMRESILRGMTHYETGGVVREHHADGDVAGKDYPISPYDYSSQFVSNLKFKDGSEPPPESPVTGSRRKQVEVPLFESPPVTVIPSVKGNMGSFSSNSQFGPISGGALLSGSDEQVPSMGGRLTADLPNGFNASFVRTRPMDIKGGMATTDVMSLAKQINDHSVGVQQTKTGPDGLPTYSVQYEKQFEYGRPYNTKGDRKGNFGQAYIDVGGTPKTPEKHIMGGVKFKFAEGGDVKAYPMREHKEWREHKDYNHNGGTVVHMTPDEFIKKSNPLNMDQDDHELIHHFKKHMEDGKQLDPLALYPDGHQDGRHRAHAAKKLGIKKVPVIVWPKGKD